MPARHQRGTLLPYTTLFRSDRIEREIRRVNREKRKEFNRIKNQTFKDRNMPTELTVEGQKYKMGDARFKKLDQLTFKDRKSTRLNSSHVAISYAVFCLKKKN